MKNGLTYYSRRTASSPGRADFYLVQNVGALMEEEEQNGLAHVLEHMAFHATDNFPEGVPAFLKRHGISNFNAYTGHDETVYNVNNVPTASKSLVDSCILILRDWSGFLKLYPEEMEIERQVIQEERRAGMDLATRLQTRANFFIYNGSKYATHDVIGSVEVLQNFTAEQVRNYYKDFYRSDLQAVIILGDINVEEVEAEVKRLFIPISRRENPKPRLVYDISDSPEPQYYKLIDKDVPTNGMVLMKRFRKNPVNSLRDMLREDLMREFYNKIMRDHLAECMESNDLAFLDASIGIFDIVRDYEGLNMMVSSLPGQEIEALEQLMEQMVRV
ncbi:MAG: M16 family metallopeptidase, partial [Butyricimonas faecihominis]